jgi:response regulator RpfG family c-di-GMP phosphodiesterase
MMRPTTHMSRRAFSFMDEFGTLTMKNGHSETILRVLLVEDSQDDADLIIRTLKRGNNGNKLEVRRVDNMRDVIAAFNTETWDLVICDYSLPGFDATKVIQVLEDNDLDIPFILVSGAISDKLAHDAMAMGAHEYVRKDDIARLMPVIRRELKISAAYDGLLNAWVRALSFRDKETKGHSERVVDLTVRLARKMGIAESMITHVRRGALLHDIGKLGVSDSILLKRGKLTEDEMERMKLHPMIGRELLSKIPFLKRAVDIPHYHHERWNGSGYPYGLVANEIPLSARIFAVVDVWDAMTSNRPYREALSRETVLKYIEGESGFSFDPSVVEAFIKMMEAA